MKSPASRLPWLLPLILAGLFLAGCTRAAPPPSTQAGVAALPTISSPTPLPTSTLRPSATPLLATALPASVTPSPPATPTPIPTKPVPASPTGMAVAPTPPAVSPRQTQVIGYSHQGRPLTSYRFGEGPVVLILIGAIHGGYEWNSALVAYRILDHIEANPALVPPAVTLYIIPVANPDGLALVTGKNGRFSPEDIAADTVPGRFNGIGVDLNRNWDCQWQPTARWRDQDVDAGSAPFSEPENVALRDFILEQDPAAVVFYHSALDAVLAAGCPETYEPARELAQLYGTAAGYPVYDTFDAYPITGDAADWLAAQGIPAITVELSTHEALDWAQNRAGVEALLREYGNVPAESGDEAE